MSSSRLRPSRAHALAGGILYLVTFVSIPTVALYAPITTPAFLTGSGVDAAVTVGAVLDLVVALACIGTAVALYPVLRLGSRSLAIGFVASRTLEAATIFAGFASLLAVITLRSAFPGAPGAEALVALHLALRLGQGILPVVNAVLLGLVLLRTRLVPRLLPVLALVGAPLLAASTLGTMLGAWPQFSSAAALFAIPIALWELGLGLWLTARGFRAVPVAAAFDAERG